MSIEESDTTLVGLDWETWQRVTQTRGLTAASGTNYDAAAMPSQKAICYGFYPSIELESMLLINCKKCGLILKDVGYGHHMRSQHGYHINSGSGDECQSFLLSPPHRVVSPRLEMPILSPPYRRLSTPITSPKESSGRNGSIISQATSTRYSVEQKDDLKLSLRVSRHEVSNEASEQNNSTLLNGTKDEVQISTKVNRRLNGKAKDKKGKKRRRDSSDEDNFSLEHFRQKKRLSKKEQSAGEANESTSSNVFVRHGNTGDSHIYNGVATASQSTKVSPEISRVEAFEQPASVSALLPMNKKVQSATALKSIDNIERLQKENEETFDTKEQSEMMANCSGQWNEVNLDTDYADLSQDVATCPTLKSEKGEIQQSWTPNAILSPEDSSNESHLCEDPDPHRFYVPSPPQLSPVAEKEYYMDSLTAPIASPQEDIYHDHHVEENLLSESHERLIPNGYREVVDLSQTSSLYPNLNLGLNDYGAVRHRCVVLEENVNASSGNIETPYPIEERIVATGPCLYGYPRTEVSDTVRSRHLLRNEESYMGNKFDHRTHPVVEKICLPHQQPRCPQLVSVAFVPQKKSSRTCSSPPIEEFCTGDVSYRDVYIDQEQKIYYPNARLLTVPINGKTTVDYPPQTRSSPPDIFSMDQNHGMHDLPDDVERSPPLPSFHPNMAEGMHREMRDPAQLVNQELQQHYDQVDYNLRSERVRLSLGRNSAIKITNEAMSEHPYNYSPMTSVSLHGNRNSNYVSHVTRKKGFSPRVIRTVRSHVDTAQHPATSQVIPHEVCVPIHGRTVIRPDYRYVYIPPKSSNSADLDHIYNRQRKDREREMNEFSCAETRHMEHQPRVEPTIRQVAIQKVQPTVLSRIRPLSTTNESARSVKVPTHRRLSHHYSSSGTEKTLVFHPELKNEGNSYPATSIADVVRINAKDRIYQASGLHSYATAGNVQRGTNVASKSKQRSNCNPSYQIQQNITSRQVRKTKVTPPADDMESRFGGICLLMRHGFLKSPKDFYSDYIGSHLLNNGVVKDCSSFVLSMENHPIVPHGITVQTAQLRKASLTGNRHTVTVVPVPIPAKCSNSTHYNNHYQASLFGLFHPH
ncbi:Chromatin assembly factor 1 subunit [Dirofilaria immitis]